MLRTNAWKSWLCIQCVIPFFFGLAPFQQYFSWPLQFWGQSPTGNVNRRAPTYLPSIPPSCCSLNTHISPDNPEIDIRLVQIQWRTSPPLKFSGIIVKTDVKAAWYSNNIHRCSCHAYLYPFPADNYFQSLSRSREHLWLQRTYGPNRSSNHLTLCVADWCLKILHIWLWGIFSVRSY